MANSDWLKQKEMYKLSQKVVKDKAVLAQSSDLVLPSESQFCLSLPLLCHQQGQPCPKAGSLLVTGWLSMETWAHALLLIWEYGDFLWLSYY